MSYATASNAAATITLAASGDNRHVLPRLVWSYSATPTNGTLTVTSGGTTVLSVDIPVAGPGFLDLGERNELCSPGEEVVVTLSAGGSGVVGKLTIVGPYTT